MAPASLAWPRKRQATSLALARKWQATSLARARKWEPCRGAATGNAASQCRPTNIFPRGAGAQRSACILHRRRRRPASAAAAAVADCSLFEIRKRSPPLRESDAGSAADPASDSLSIRPYSRPFALFAGNCLGPWRLCACPVLHPVAFPLSGICYGAWSPTTSSLARRSHLGEDGWYWGLGARQSGFRAHSRRFV